jgi:hypothetical protein
LSTIMFMRTTENRRQSYVEPSKLAVDVVGDITRASMRRMGYKGEDLVRSLQLPVMHIEISNTRIDPK